MASLAGLFLYQAARIRRETGLSFGEILYRDDHQMEENNKTFYDRKLGLAGRPDYLIRENGMVIPVEVKSSKRIRTPYDSHIFQLAAYGLLVGAEFGQLPPSGILIYRDKRFRVPITESLRVETIRLVQEIRDNGRKRSLARSHDEAARCAGCGFRGICDQRLN